MLWSRRVREGVFQRQLVCQHPALGLAASTEASLQHSKHHPPIILVIHDPNHQSCWVAQKHPGASMHKPNTTCILQFAYSTRSVRQRCCTVMLIASKGSLLVWSTVHILRRSSPILRRSIEDNQASVQGSWSTFFHMRHKHANRVDGKSLAAHL